METLKKIKSIIVLALSSIILISCNDNDDNLAQHLTPSQILSSTAWETTNAKNEKGESVPLTDPDVAGSVGYAYFKTDGTFTIFSLQDAPRIQGDWSVPADGKTRTLVARDINGKELFTRVVEITVLTMKEFTYRIYPNADNRAIYFDIIHTPTTHKEPARFFTPSQVLSSTAWETTGAKNERGENVALTTEAVAGAVGYAYFKTNGTFTIFSLQDEPRIQGDWTVSADGATRTLVAKDAAGNELFTRVVEITVLTTREFTYRMYPNANNRTVYFDIIHTPTTHTEPTPFFK